MSTTPDIIAKESAWPRTVDAALFRWDDEGGAVSEGGHDCAKSSQHDWLTASARDELALLRGRVMASMPMLLAVLATASDRHLEILDEGTEVMCMMSREDLHSAGMLLFS